MNKIKKYIAAPLIAIMVMLCVPAAVKAETAYTYTDGTYTSKATTDAFEYQLVTVVSKGKIASASIHLYSGGTCVDSYVDENKDLKATYESFTPLIKDMISKNNGSAVDTDNEIFKKLVLGLEIMAGKKAATSSSSSSTSSDTIKSYTPKITSYKAGAKTISGACIKNSVVYVKVGTKTYTDKTTSTGKYSVKVSALKKGTKISVYLKADGVKSKTKSVTVK